MKTSGLDWAFTENGDQNGSLPKYRNQSGFFPTLELEMKLDICMSILKLPSLCWFSTSSVAFIWHKFPSVVALLNTLGMW